MFAPRERTGCVHTHVHGPRLRVRARDAAGAADGIVRCHRQRFQAETAAFLNAKCARTLVFRPFGIAVHPNDGARLATDRQPFPARDPDVSEEGIDAGRKKDRIAILCRLARLRDFGMAGTASRRIRTVVGHAQDGTGNRLARHQQPQRTSRKHASSCHDHTCIPLFT